MEEYIYHDNGKEKHALIFIWVQFQKIEGKENSPPAPRFDAMRDQMLEKTWRQLGFKTECLKNIKKSQFREKIKQVQECYKEGDYSKLAIVISTHGIEEERTTTLDSGDQVRRVEHILRVQPDEDDSPNEDDHYILLGDDLIGLFDFPEIAVPKIFLIQSCRERKNENFDQGLEITLVDTIEDEYKLAVEPVLRDRPREGAKRVTYDRWSLNSGTYVPVPDDQPPDCDNNEIPYTPPCVKDGIVVFSSPSGYTSMTVQSRGSILLVEISEQFKTLNDGEFSFLKFITNVNHSLSRKQREHGNYIYKPCVSIVHQLTRVIRLTKQSA